MWVCGPALLHLRDDSCHMLFDWQQLYFSTILEWEWAQAYGYSLALGSFLSKHNIEKYKTFFIIIMFYLIQPAKLLMCFYILMTLSWGQMHKTLCRFRNKMLCMHKEKIAHVLFAPGNVVCTQAWFLLPQLTIAGCTVDTTLITCLHFNTSVCSASQQRRRAASVWVTSAESFSAGGAILTVGTTITDSWGLSIAPGLSLFITCKPSEAAMSPIIIIKCHKLSQLWLKMPTMDCIIPGLNPSVDLCCPSLFSCQRSLLWLFNEGLKMPRKWVVLYAVFILKQTSQMIKDNV